MISVIIPTSNSIRDLEPLVASLVPGAVDGLVRELVLADAGSTDATASLSEDAGAVIVQGGLADAAKAAKSDAVLIVPVDLRLPHDWIGKLASHLAAGGGDALLRGLWRNPRWIGPHIGAYAVLTERVRVIGTGQGGIEAVKRRLSRPAKLR